MILGVRSHHLQKDPTSILQIKTEEWISFFSLCQTNHGFFLLENGQERRGPRQDYQATDNLHLPRANEQLKRIQEMNKNPLGSGHWLVLILFFFFWPFFFKNRLHTLPLLLGSSNVNQPTTALPLQSTENRSFIQIKTPSSLTLMTNLETRKCCNP